MTKIVCITSMNKPYYDNIGKLMIESWAKFWPEDCKLIVYQEGFEIDVFKKVEGVDWKECCYQTWNEFAKKVDDPSNRAQTFGKKGFSMIDGMANIDCDLLIWLDADTLTLKDFSKIKIESILPNDKLIAFFDTHYQINPNYTEEEYLDLGRKCSAAESGFVVINKNHKDFDGYYNEYKRLYHAESRPPETDSWYDGHVCTLAARNYRESVVDLSKLRTKSKTQTPLNYCWIGEYVWHYKAKQKNNFDTEKYRKKLRL